MINHIHSVQFTTDDGECISVFIGEALAEIDEEGAVFLQVPVFADGRSGHLVLTEQESRVLARSPIIKEATAWALNSRMRDYKPRR